MYFYANVNRPLIPQQTQEILIECLTKFITDLKAQNISFLSKDSHTSIIAGINGVTKLLEDRINYLNTDNQDAAITVPDIPGSGVLRHIVFLFRGEGQPSHLYNHIPPLVNLLCPPAVENSDNNDRESLSLVEKFTTQRTDKSGKDVLCLASINITGAESRIAAAMGIKRCACLAIKVPGDFGRELEINHEIDKVLSVLGGIGPVDIPWLRSATRSLDGQLTPKPKFYPLVINNIETTVGQKRSRKEKKMDKKAKNLTESAKMPSSSGCNSGTAQTVVLDNVSRKRNSADSGAMNALDESKKKRPKRLRDLCEKIFGYHQLIYFYQAHIFLPVKYSY
ncbi:hypothetical protein BKA69DRAFT_720214 [Paraphysoderma sedebokerense]|nr:hypothetical protein BKA69DRAFT_720214 [Paraphysoderma sedebokerense]